MWFCIYATKLTVKAKLEIIKISCKKFSQKAGYSKFFICCYDCGLTHSSIKKNKNCIWE